MFGGAIDGGVAHVAWIVVDSEVRGRGIGERLMEATFTQYRERGAHKVVLYTETEAARRFYEGVGMQLEGTHPNHWWKLKHYCFGRLLRQESDNASSESPTTP